MDSPDKFTNAWWKKQFEEVLKGYRGATHGINRCLADFEDAWKAIEELREQCESLRQERDDANAEIGRLAEELKRVSDRQDKIAEYVKDNVPKKAREET